MSTVILSVVVPCYNEEAGITRSVDIILGHITEITESYELILVDDGSSDNTFRKLIELSSENNKIKNIRFTRNFGKEAAILAGLRYSTGKAVVVMDADLQHPPEMLKTMYRFWHEDGYKIVEAIKKYQATGYGLSNAISKFFNLIMSRMSGLNMNGASDFKLIDRRVVNEIIAMPERDRFYRGLVNWTGYKTAQVLFEVPERIAGVSKWSFLSLFRLSVSAITSFSNIPLYITTYLGVFTLIFSFGLSLHTLFNKFFGTAVSGFTTVIIIILFLCSLIMISLGIIGIYIANIYMEIKKRPYYIISDNYIE